jgi:hypothetical protein
MAADGGADVVVGGESAEVGDDGGCGLGFLVGELGVGVEVFVEIFVG